VIRFTKLSFGELRSYRPWRESCSRARSIQV
jgi:hypothetical protein